MNFAASYFSRFTTYNYAIAQPPHANVEMIVVIPCFNEPDILQTLHSLYACTTPACFVEIVIVVNHGEHVNQSIVYANEATCKEIEAFAAIHKVPHITTHVVYAPQLPKKHAGVGLARKIGMDEAVRRFSIINKPHGIIVSLDADSEVAPNYLSEIFQYFSTNYRCAIAPIYFEHPLRGNLPNQQYLAIAQYELYLRWYVHMLRSIGFPFAHHTVGSSFALRAHAYCRQGGMNKRQAGEDFYFLQKMYEAEQVGSITSTTVYPSARISTRVPFGTGYAMYTVMQSEQYIYYSYHPSSFEPLKELFDSIPKLYKAHIESLKVLFYQFDTSVQAYITCDIFLKKIQEIQKNSTSLPQFTKRFYLWINGFVVFKYLNTVHQTIHIKVPIEEAAAKELRVQTRDVFALLHVFRKRDRKG